MSRFRDDTQNIALVLDVWLDVSGAVVASSSALAVMAGVDARVAAIVALPVLAALALCRWLGQRLRRLRRAEREATAAVTGFIGDTFGAITAVKAAGAEAAVLARFDRLGGRRAMAARSDQVTAQMLQTLSGAVGNVGVGLVLLVLAPGIRRGEVTVGDIGLFTASITVLAQLPRWAARLGAYQRQADVSVERLTELLPAAERDARRLARPVALDLRHGPPPMAPVSGASDRERLNGHSLRRLDVHGLTVTYPGGAGLHGVDLAVGRGTVTAITGPVGAGKSTLVRGLLGLIPVDGGTVAWNGRPVAEPSVTLVPPLVAYVPQVPRLFSEGLADTVLLGLDPAPLDHALFLACLDDDVAAMPAGVATVVGPKGVRLSGGQIQRAGAARAFVRRPELLVVDDLSSALDVDTEAQLWDRLLESGDRRPTLLVVTHRPRVLERADEVVVLDRGRRVA